MAQKRYNMQQVRSAIVFALHTVPSDALEALFAKFGYKADEINVETAVAAWRQYGNEFMVPFAELAQGVLNDEEQMDEIKKHWLSISRSDGKTSSSSSSKSSSKSSSTTSSSDSKTSEQKWETAKSVISDIFGFAVQGYAAYSTIRDGETADDTEEEETEKEAESVETKSSFPWIAIGVGVGMLILVIVLVAVLSKRK